MSTRGGCSREDASESEEEGPEEEQPLSWLKSFATDIVRAFARGRSAHPGKETNLDVVD